MPSEFDPLHTERYYYHQMGTFPVGRQYVYSEYYDSLLALHRADRERIKELEEKNEDKGATVALWKMNCETRAARNEESQERIASLEDALKELMPSEYISTEKIGWRGTNPPTSAHFQCEFCNASDLDCILIPHKSDCIILRLRALLAPNVEETKET